MQIVYLWQLLYIIFYLFLTMLNYREMEMTYLMKSGVRVYAMCLGPCGPCTSLYSYPLGLASCIYQLPETWYRARGSTSLPCAAATSLPCCRRRAQGRRQRQVPRLPGAAPARSAPARRSARLALPWGAPPCLCLAAHRGAPLCSPGPALPSSVPGERRQEPRRARQERPGARPRPPSLCPARPDAPERRQRSRVFPPPMDAEFPPLSTWVRAASPGRPAAVPPAAATVLRPPWGAGPIAAGGSLTATGTASVLAAVADAPPAGVAGPEDPPPPIPSSPVVDPPPPPPPVAHQGSTVAALTASRAEHAARQARLREAALVWEREREAADAIAAQIVAAEQLLASPVTSSDTVGGVYGVPPAPTVGTGPRTIPTVLWHDPADPLVAQLHLQAGSVQNIRLMVPVVLEPESSS
jgi:hypothetical protein